MKPGKKPFENKICPDCKVEKPRSEYYKKLDTVSYLCKVCSLASSKKRAPQYLGKYTEYQNEWRRTKYTTDANYREKIATQKKVTYDKNNAALNERRRIKWATDPLCSARKYYRRKDVKDRTPKWVDLSEILAFYAKCPKGYEVDHIIPLKGIIDGRHVCGLHVLWNLQYLTPTENRKKKNIITEQMLQRDILKR